MRGASLQSGLGASSATSIMQIGLTPPAALMGKGSSTRAVAAARVAQTFSAEAYESGPGTCLSGLPACADAQLWWRKTVRGPPYAGKCLADQAATRSSSSAKYEGHHALVGVTGAGTPDSLTAKHGGPAVKALSEAVAPRLPQRGAGWLEGSTCAAFTRAALSQQSPSCGNMGGGRLAQCNVRWQTVLRGRAVRPTSTGGAHVRVVPPVLCVLLEDLAALAPLGLRGIFLHTATQTLPPYQRCALVQARQCACRSPCASGQVVLKITCDEMGRRDGASTCPTLSQRKVPLGKKGIW